VTGDQPTVGDARPGRPPATLRIEGLSVRYGGVAAVSDLSMEAGHGELCGLIGPNGSGKSTTLAALSRLVRPAAGRLMWRDRDYSRASPARVIRLGIARTFQTVRLVPELTVLENVMVGADAHRPGMGFATSFRLLRGFRAEEADTRARALDALGRVGMAAAAHLEPGALSYGQQRRVELARALAAEPSLLLLDEPTAGMSEAERAEIATLLRALCDGGMSMILVEHNLRFINDICDWVYVMDRGRCIAAGAAGEVSRDPVVVDAYLGGSPA
jgi:ABC-type branched-subunit amino acid transport system ATPase component